MHFDDRLATVLRLPASGNAFNRIQYRQLLDILGGIPETAEGPQVDAAYTRLKALTAAIPARDQVDILRHPFSRLRNRRLIALLADGEPAVAGAAIAAVRMDEDGWLALVPELPVRARGILRHRGGLGPRVERLLERLGIADRGLPPADVLTLSTLAETEPDRDIPGEAEENAPPQPPPLILPPESDSARCEDGNHAGDQGGESSEDSEIAALLKRIEAFSKARREAGAGPMPGSDTPPLPFGDEHSAPRGMSLTTFDFETDAEGRISWADPEAAPMVIGLRLASPDGAGPLRAPPALIAALRHRQPLRGLEVHLEGAPGIEGQWQLDATPRFEAHSGGFIGYLGRFRRARLPSGTAGAEADHASPETDRMRQILHELRTPANAIQLSAEIIQQNLFGPTPHEYRALAAAIASDTAQILAGFDEIERLMKLEARALAIEPGTSEMGEVTARIVSQLGAFTARRNSGFAFTAPHAPVLVAIAEIELERLVWRILAVLAGTAAPNEVLSLSCRSDDGHAALLVELPDVLAQRDEEDLFRASAGGSGTPQALSAGMFGIGFSLRLARAEAAAAGGTLQRNAKHLSLSLPALAETSAVTGQR